uniref:Uncharacterized protein n=1 Tax=Strongyloides papillosus TaxID=174720 RepID=A0A0N5CD57_STREA
MISTTIVSETYTETETNETFPQAVDSKKLQNRLESLRQRLKLYKKNKEEVVREMCEVGENIKTMQEAVQRKQLMIDEINSGMNMILKETQKWIDLWNKEEGRLRVEKNAKDLTENYLQVDQLSIYIMHLREAILKKRTLIEEREIDLENQKKHNKIAIDEIKNEILYLKKEIATIKNNPNLIK